MAASAVVIHGRYQLSGKPIGQGGMGVVYKAYDVATKRHVALKSMRGAMSAAALELFNKEWSVLAHLSHPNIVDVLDTGEFEHDGEKRPFFVMPFLPGATLDQLLQDSSTRLTLERIVSIVAQVCRGLQAAHEQGVVHRDLKPSNIFILADDAVKIIDFGIVHLVGAESVRGLKGTLQYMSPEQVDLKPSSPASDIFSLAVVCYEALTGRKPFSRKAEFETVEAIRHHIPPVIGDLNPLVPQAVSRVIHKGMAKDPWHRFSSAKEFSECLQKALRGEPLERFDPAKLTPRIDRAKKANATGDHQFASEILSELEAEGNVDPEMSLLRIQIDQATRQKAIRQLLESARTRLEEDEFPLALQKIQEVLEIDPDNPDALGLRSLIEKQRSHRQIENWYRLVDQHLHNNSFAQARQGLEEILKLNPNEARAKELLTEVDRRQKEVDRARKEKEQLYQSALDSYQRGEVSTALTKLERILDLTRRSPDSTIPDREAQYQSLYNQIRTEREAARSAYAEGQRHLADRNFVRALDICNEQLQRAPGDPMFQALKLEAEEQQRQDQSAYMADVSRRAEAERDLERRVNILKEAVERYPDEPHLQQSLRLVRERRDLVNSIVERARQYEERSQFNEALSQFDILRNIYSQYPGIEFETERLKRRRDAQIREESKARWVEQIDRYIALGDYARARELVRTALAEFPEDRELAELERLAEGALTRAAESEEWLQRGQKLCFDRQFGEGLEALRKAASLDNRNPVIRAALLNALVEQARSVLGQDWRAAEPLIEQALNIDGGHPLARSLQGLVLDYKRQEILNDCVSQAREMQANGDLAGALGKVEEVLGSFPNEPRLVQLRSTLRNLGAVSPAVPAPPPPPPQLPDGATRSETRPQAQIETVVLGNPSSSAGQSAFTVDRSMAVAAAAAKSAPVPQKAHPAAEAWKRFTAGVKRFLGRLVSVLQGWAEPTGRLSKLQWALIAATPIILILALIARPKPKPVALPTEYAVDIQSNIANAKYRVDQAEVESLPKRLKPGTHTVEAFSPGYRPKSQTFELRPGVPSPFPVPLTLVPEPIRLRMSSGLKAGQVVLDDQPPVDLQDGSFTNDAVALSGEHRFVLTQGGKETLSFSFRGEPGGVVTLTSPIKTKDLSVTAIANLASRTHVYSSDPTLKAGLKDGDGQLISADGIELGAITASSEIKLDDGKSPRTYPLDLNNAPTLTIWLASDPNLGTVQVEVLPAGTEGWLDGRKLRPLRTGANYFGLEPGPRKLRFTKEGYDPVERSVTVKKGEPVSLGLIELKPSIKTATLVIEGATRGAEVLVDGNARGVIADDGSSTMNDLTPGPHIITLRKLEFEDRAFPRDFSIGQTVHISDAQLTPFGTIAFRVVPRGAIVTYKRSDEAQAHTFENGKSIAVRAGRYDVSATAANFRERREPITVDPARATSVAWELQPLVETKNPGPTPPPLPKLTTADYFQNPTAWTQDGDWWAHKGSGVSWLRRNQGVFVIEFQRQTAKKIGLIKTTRHIEWVIEQKDPKNHVDYSFDFTKLERQATVAGKSQSKQQKPLPTASSGDSYVLRFEIGQDQIVIKDSQGTVLDIYQWPDKGEPLGRFGFKGDMVLVIRRVE